MQGLGFYRAGVGQGLRLSGVWDGDQVTWAEGATASAWNKGGHEHSPAIFIGSPNLGVQRRDSAESLSTTMPAPEDTHALSTPRGFSRSGGPEQEREGIPRGELARVEGTGQTAESALMPAEAQTQQSWGPCAQRNDHSWESCELSWLRCCPAGLSSCSKRTQHLSLPFLAGPGVS